MRGCWDQSTGQTVARRGSHNIVSALSTGPFLLFPLLERIEVTAVTQLALVPRQQDMELQDAYLPTLAYRRHRVFNGHAGKSGELKHIGS